MASVTGAACLIVLIFFTSRMSKRGSAWRKLDAAEADSIVPGLNVGGSRTAGAVSEQRKLPTANQEQTHQRNFSSTAWEDSSYCWVVICKNNWVHRRPNIFHVHRIPLAETDAVSPRPTIVGRFAARCDSCGKEYIYKPSEVMRYEQEFPASSTPHPLFREEI